MHVDSWGKLIDPRATARHHTYAIVADNTLASIWNDLAMLREAITEIETANSEVTPIDFTISNMVWLNSQEAHDKTSVLALCRETGVDTTFRTGYMHPEKRNKAWFGSFQLQ